MSLIVAAGFKTAGGGLVLLQAATITNNEIPTSVEDFNRAYVSRDRLIGQQVRMLEAFDNRTPRPIDSASYSNYRNCRSTEGEET